MIQDIFTFGNFLWSITIEGIFLMMQLLSRIVFIVCNFYEFLIYIFPIIIFFFYKISKFNREEDEIFHFIISTDNFQRLDK